MGAVVWLSGAGRMRHGDGFSEAYSYGDDAQAAKVWAPLRKLPGPVPLAALLTSPWIPKKCELPVHHRQACKMQANVDFTFAKETMWTSSERHVSGPEKCCASCQANRECKAWSWVKNAGPFENWYRCFLKGGEPTGTQEKNGVISGLPPPRLELKRESSKQGPNGTSLYCFSLMRPGSEEVGLLEMQEKTGGSIFSCEEAAVYSNQAMQIGSLTATVINSDLKCKTGGDYGKALNSWIFIEVWRKVIDEGRYYHHDWTVKVDPDAVFFPDRLKVVLQDHSEAGYVNNCAEGMHGAIEVLSRKAVGALAWDYRSNPNKTFPKKCVASQEMSRWGEDMFLDKCLMDTLSVRREFDIRLMCEEACGCPDWYWCQNGTERVTFHPFKTTDSYTNCMANAMGGAAPMPPPPLPCAKPGQQCGGRGWSGTTCCMKGYECKTKSSLYSSCEEGCAEPLGQCGGKLWKGATCCTNGYTCGKKNDWYSQCRPPWAPPFSDGTDSSSASKSPAPAPSWGSCAGPEEQCGGDGFEGKTCCQSGYSCKEKNRWYWECQ